MTENKKTAVYLTSEECELFKRFCQYRPLWDELFNSVYDSVKINRNPDNGELEIWEWYKKDKIKIKTI